MTKAKMNGEAHPLVAVQYRVADNPGAYKAARDFLRAEKVKFKQLNFPTVVGWENGEVVAVLGTDTSQKMVVAGPLHVKQSDKKRWWPIIRIIEYYDDFMKNAGIKSYLFSCEKTNRVWLDYIQRTYELDPYAADADWFYFIKRI